MRWPRPVTGAARVCSTLRTMAPRTLPALDSPLAVTRLYAAIADTLRAATGSPGRGPAVGGRGPAVSGRGPAAGRPGIVVVQDVHWADSSSLGLLAYLVRRLADWPLLLVLSWQPEQAGQLRVLRTALGEAEAQSVGETIEPGLLDPEAIGSLLRLDGMPKIDVSRLLAETRGLPMLVREYVEALRTADGRADGPAGEPAGPEAPGGQADWWPPASVRDLLLARLQAVSEPTRQMLAAAAVLGNDNDADLLRAVSGRGEDEIVEALDEALARSLLTEAAQWWWRAAEVARELYAHAEARAHLAKALELGYPQLPGRLAMGEVLVVLGRYREALAEFETAAAIAGGESDRAAQAAIEHKLADVHHRLGDWDLAEAHLAVVTELLTGTDPGRLARVEADRAVVAYRRGAVDQAAERGRTASTTPR